MHIKELEKATAMLQRIKILDNEIIEIEKIAMIVANNDIDTNFQLKVIDKENTSEDDEQKPVEFDFGEYSGFLGFMAFRNDESKKKENKNVHTINYDLSITATMQILGVLLYEKQTLRQSIIKKLNKYGVST